MDFVINRKQIKLNNEDLCLFSYCLSGSINNIKLLFNLKKDKLIYFNNNNLTPHLINYTLKKISDNHTSINTKSVIQLLFSLEFDKSKFDYLILLKLFIYDYDTIEYLFTLDQYNELNYTLFIIFCIKNSDDTRYIDLVKDKIEISDILFKYVCLYDNLNYFIKFSELKEYNDTKVIEMCCIYGSFNIFKYMFVHNKYDYQKLFIMSNSILISKMIYENCENISPSFNEKQIDFLCKNENKHQYLAWLVDIFDDDCFLDLVFKNLLKYCKGKNILILISTKYRGFMNYDNEFFNKTLYYVLTNYIDDINEHNDEDKLYIIKNFILKYITKISFNINEILSLYTIHYSVISLLLISKK